MLHKSDPWQGRDCERVNCLLCETKKKTGKYLQQECTKRNVIYETWCMMCEGREVERIEEEEEDEKERVKKLKKIKLYKYVGETSRSFYERGLEQLRDKDELKMDSHMIKHFFDKHAEDCVFCKTKNQL